MDWQDIVRTDRAWNAARKDFLEKGTEPSDPVLLRYLKYGSTGDLPETCRQNLLKDHPQDFIDTD